MRTSATARGLAAAGLALAAVALAGCRQDMHDQAKYEPHEASAFFADGSSARLPVEGTVARGHLRDDDRFYTGQEPDGGFVADLPVALTPELLARGRKGFESFCAPCHDRVGNGRGMVVQRGFKQPASFHEARLQQIGLGYFYVAITSGFGEMSSYADKLDPEDRWAVAAYIRALQLSQNAPRELLGADDLERLGGGEETP